MNKQGRFTAVLLSGVILCGIGTGCTADGSKTAKADYTWSNVAIGGGGYVTGMEYNPKEEGLVYARTDIGGLYRRKKDTDWEPLTDFLGADEWGYIGIESMATDPVEPNRVYFAGGTYMSDDAALFASDDYGETWTRFDAPFSCGGNQSGRGCGERMCVNPNNNKEVWFGSRDSGLWKTTDYGKNWEEVTSFPEKGDYKQESNSIYFNDTCTWNDLYFCTFVPPNEWIMEKDYFSHILPNGLRIVHLPSASPVSYCGFAVNAGTRDEEMDEFGLAHFVEHMIFKGTEKRKSWHILNRMENVGGELNAYTTKEETFVYSIFMEEHFRRAFELLSDLVFHSQFPEQEIEKEVDVILDEINSYEDSPSELIFDEFENLLFDGHALGHNILGDEQSLLGFGSESGKSFMRRFYAPENMVFFSMGRIPFKKIVQMAESTLSDIAFPMAARNRTAPGELLPVSRQIHKDTHQAHVLIGGRAYSMHDEKRLPLFLLNNLLGGPGMNNRLNVSLREKNGLVYNVESNVTSYTDTGLASIYFGTDPKNKEKAIRLVYKELAKLREVKLTATQLAAAKKQVIGQLGVSGDNREGLFLGLGKSFLHYNRYDTLPEVFAKVEKLTAGEIREVANEIFAPERLFSLIYQ